jgi:predicted dinucleotide-binding enzyme
MPIGIIGAGALAQALTQRLVASGLRALLSNRSGPDTLGPVVRALGPAVTAASVRGAAQAAIVVVAVPWAALPAALADLPPWQGRIVIDATNPVLLPGFRLAPLDGRASSAVVRDLVPGARLVKAFNTLPPALLAADPRAGRGRRVLFFSGDDARAKEEVGRLIERLGFAGIDLGTLADGGRMQQFPGGPLPALDLLKVG